MCDTILAAPDVTADAAMAFGKNSDREPNEAHLVEILPGASHVPGSSMRCTYVTIPQARRTYATLLCRPFWIWGAEMGANERGVVIGNEGLHSRTPPPRAPALTGMDLVRLGLERAGSAAEAVEVMTDLLAVHGQGGNCGYLAPSYYQNGFLIADHAEAFVLETVDREWVVERVSGVRTISNWYTIGEEFERQSAGMPKLLASLATTGERRDIKATVADPGRSHISSARERQSRTTAVLSGDAGRLDVGSLMRALRDHKAEAPICMHAGGAGRVAQTTGSLVSTVYADVAVHWVTATAAPCLSAFKPLFIDLPVPAHGSAPTATFDPNSLWWSHERLHRRALMADFAEVQEQIGRERDVLETEFRARIRTVMRGTRAERKQTVELCWSEAMAAERRWEDATGLINLDARAFDPEWAEINRLAGMQL